MNELTRKLIRPMPFAEPEVSFAFPSPWGLLESWYQVTTSTLLGPIAAEQPDSYALFVLRTKSETIRPLELKGLERYVRSAEVRRMYEAAMRKAILRDIAAHYAELSPTDIFRYELLSSDPTTRGFCREVRAKKIVENRFSPLEAMIHDTIAPPGESVREIQERSPEYWGYI